ncbi:transmembrane protein 127, partial [Chelydra serpentina]
QLPRATQHSLAAAMCQGLGMAALCIAISNLAWITLETNVPLHLLTSKYWAVIYVFGVPVRLQAQQWLNETLSTEIVLLSSDQWVFIDLMMGICFLSLLAGFIAFFLDFIEIKKLGVARLIIATVLHILSAILCALVLVFCSWLLTVVQKPSINNLLHEHYYATSLGESFYLTIAAFSLASLASLFSVWSTKVYGKDLLPSERVWERGTKESNRFGPGASLQP